MFALPAASSYCLLVNGLGIGQGLALELCALLLMSWVGGLLAFVFPAGIGIREFIFFSLGGMLSHAPGIALASRVTQILIDIVGVLLFLASRWLLATVKKQV